MFDLDRWLKRLWLVNGALLLALLVFGIGALIVEWLSGTFSRRNAVIAPDTAASASARPRAVRFSPPRRVLGTSTRIVVVRYGKGQQGADFASGAALSGSGFYSYSEGRDADGPVVNLLFVDGTKPGRMLLDRPAYVGGFDYPYDRADSLERWITYRIAFEDTNHDGQLDGDDERDLYMSDLDGTNLRRVLPADMQVLETSPVGDGRHVIVTALEVPKDWHGSDEELPQRAFLYDVRAGVLTPHAALDSLALKAARLLGRP
ncbi:MAG TPA: hypothetical protein VGQ06_03045 [Gemmatimonadales bacterium]|jgi:hypothetical protein|nr:hypothetical protein [Gemmatimonadales bacterium]